MSTELVTDNAALSCKRLELMALIKSAATVGGYTLLSRLLGFVRDMLMASIIGSGPVAEAFVIAFRFPNLFRRLFGEGAFNAAFVPMFAKRHESDGNEAARGFAEEVYAVLLVTLLALVAVCELLMPVLMYLFAPGFAADPAKFDLAIVMTRIAFPYLLFMSLVALLGGVLNSLHRFVAAAAAPIVLNVVMISVLATIKFGDWGSGAKIGQALVWGVSLAGLLQFLMLTIACRRSGMHLKLVRPRITPQVRRLVRLGVPGTIAGGITQLNLVISTMIASLHAGAASWLYYADRVYQLPLGIVGVAVGTVLLPELSRRLRAGDDAGVESSQNRALELSLLLTVPAAVGLMALSNPVVNVLFERGAFTPADTRATSGALAAFALGLPAFVMMKVFAPGFFAREDTHTPMKFAIVGVGLNVAGALVLFPFLSHVGIAIATSLSAWVNAGLLGITLQKRGCFVADRRLKSAVARIILASLGMGAALIAVLQVAGVQFMPGVGIMVRVAVLSGLVVAGAGFYFGLTWLSGAFRPHDFARAFRRSR